MPRPVDELSDAADQASIERDKGGDGEVEEARDGRAARHVQVSPWREEGGKEGRGGGKHTVGARREGQPVTLRA